MRLYDAGRMVLDYWRQIPQRFAQVEVDLCVVMPNHFHGILLLYDPALVEPRSISSVGAPSVGASGGAGSRAPTRGAPTLGEVIGAFKSLTTNAYIRGVHEQGWPRFNGRQWQRNFYERIIRNERQLNALRQYIIDNPTNWARDTENPDVISA
jgi:putative transposase